MFLESQIRHSVRTTTPLTRSPHDRIDGMRHGGASMGNERFSQEHLGRADLMRRQSTAGNPNEKSEKMLHRCASLLTNPTYQFPFYLLSLSFNRRPRTCLS